MVFLGATILNCNKAWNPRGAEGAKREQGQPTELNLSSSNPLNIQVPEK